MAIETLTRPISKPISRSEIRTWKEDRKSQITDINRHLRQLNEDFGRDLLGFTRAPLIEMRRSLQTTGIIFESGKIEETTRSVRNAIHRS